MRDENGLVIGVNYPKDEHGFIKWRELIDNKYLYANKEWFESKGLEVPNTIEGLKDNQLLIMLGGIKDLLALRGYTSCDITTNTINENYVTAKCSIRFIKNVESENEYNDSILFSANANATKNNTTGFGGLFLETIAENRAFIRCVRNFLRIHIVGADEIAPTKKEEVYQNIETEGSSLSGYEPYNILELKAQEKGLTSFEMFVGWLRSLYKREIYRNESAGKWKTFKDIPVSEIRKLIKFISSEESQETDSNEVDFFDD